MSNVRTFIILSLFVFPPLANAITYYVAPNGSNSSPGTQAAPFATLQKAHDVANPGDTIYMRGGTYNISAQQALTRSGSSGNYIKLFNYPGEIPVLNAAGITQDTTWVIRTTSGSWWHIKGLEIRNNPRGGGINLATSNNIIENNNIHHNGALTGWAASGISFYQGLSNNLILNNDVHHNRDADSGDADGISVAHNLNNGNVLRGNRAWRNSDDGIDLWNSANITLEKNWVWENGLDDNLQPLGDGQGFKLGGSGASDGNHTLKNNVSWKNRSGGFNYNAADRPSTLYNNTSWSNPAGNYIFARNANTFRNNISFGSLGSISGSDTYNSWTLGVTVSAADFSSLDDACARGPRQADGSLPNCSFAHLAAGSDLIDKGVNVGIAYTGSAPDLGAFEYGGATPPPPTSLPDVIVTSLSYANGVFTSTVKNQGAGATPAGVAVGVAYYVDGVYKTWGGLGVPPIAAGASVTVGTDGPHYTIPVGTHTIKAYVDDVNRFAESNENNNQLSQPITVP